MSRASMQLVRDLLAVNHAGLLCCSKQTGLGKFSARFCWDVFCTFSGLDVFHKAYIRWFVLLCAQTCSKASHLIYSLCVYVLLYRSLCWNMTGFVIYVRCPTVRWLSARCVQVSHFLPVFSIHYSLFAFIVNEIHCFFLVLRERRQAFSYQKFCFLNLLLETGDISSSHVISLSSYHLHFL